MTNVEKLQEKIAEIESRGGYIHFTFDNSSPASEEEKAEECLRVIIKSEEHMKLPEIERMRLAMKDAYERMGRAIKNCRCDPSDIDREWTPEEIPLRKKLSNIFGELDMARVSLGNWVRHKPFKKDNE